MEKEEELKDLKDRAQVRLLLWLGLEKDQEKWTECCGGGEVAVFAETVSQEPPPVCSLVQHISMCCQGLVDSSSLLLFVAHYIHFDKICD